MFRKLLDIDSICAIVFVGSLESYCFSCSQICSIDVGLKVELGVHHLFSIGSRRKTSLSSDKMSWVLPQQELPAPPQPLAAFLITFAVQTAII